MRGSELRRHHWDQLPEPLRRTVQQQCGEEVAKAERPSAGRQSAFSATLYLASGRRVFCKGAPTEHASMHRTEARVSHWLPAQAPRLLWQVEQDGWLLLGFEHVAGPYANLAPGSPDLPLIAQTLSAVSSTLTPCPEAAALPGLDEKMRRMSPWRRLRDDPPQALHPWARARLDRFATDEPSAIEQITGDTLQHTDVHELNVLVDGSARLVDCAWAHTAQPWVDAAYLVPRLIQAGHNPAQAQRWAGTTAGWAGISPDDLTAFAIEIYGMWEFLRHARPGPQRDGPTHAAAQWAQFRIDGTEPTTPDPGKQGTND
jgi:hypothetical protein